MEFSTQLVQHRTSANMTRLDLASLVGVSAWTIGTWEHGTHAPKPISFQKLVHATGWTFDCVPRVKRTTKTDRMRAVITDQAISEASFSGRTFPLRRPLFELIQTAADQRGETVAEWIYRTTQDETAPASPFFLAALALIGIALLALGISLA